MLLPATAVMPVALVLFLATYVLLLALPKVRAYVAVVSAVLFVALGILPLGKVFQSVEWNVILMIAGTMGVVYLFIESKMPAKMADTIIDRMPDVRWAIIALSLFAGIISAFVDNVATVLMVAPVAMTISRKLGISPVPAIIGIAISSNLQGAATLVGDTTSILLGNYANMDFLDFFVFHGRVGMFFVVQAGAVVATFVLLWLFRKDRQPIQVGERTDVSDYFPTVLLGGTVLLLILASFVPDQPFTLFGLSLPAKPAITNGLICTIVFLVGLVREFFKTGDHKVFYKSLLEIDFFTLLLLAGLFVVIGGIKEAGVVDAIAGAFVSIGSGNLFVIYTLIVWSSVLLSAFIDNIPYVAAMLPVAAGISATLGIAPTLLFFGLLAGATLGGNLTPIGASANIAGLGILRKAGHEVKAATFMKISVPFTLAAVITGYLLVWLIWHP
jgi:Na+/H+ antiporter NhaD/arsenite permease-like protein